MQREMRVPEWFTTIEIVKCFIICLYYLSSSLSLTPLLSTQPSPHLCDSLVALLSPCALIGRFKHFTRVTIIVARKSFKDSSRGWFHFISFPYLYPSEPTRMRTVELLTHHHENPNPPPFDTFCSIGFFLQCNLLTKVISAVWLYYQSNTLFGHCSALGDNLESIIDRDSEGMDDWREIVEDTQRQPLICSHSGN